MDTLVDLGRVLAMFCVLFTFWFASAMPWWAYQIFHDATDMPQPESRD